MTRWALCYIYIRFNRLDLYLYIERRKYFRCSSENFTNDGQTNWIVQKKKMNEQINKQNAAYDHLHLCEGASVI